MLFIPGWITNILLMVTAFLCILQLKRLYRPNPATALQFWMAVFCLALTLTVAWTGTHDPRLSLGFFAVAVACLLFTLRQRRYLPPPKRPPV